MENYLTNLCRKLLIRRKRHKSKAFGRERGWTILQFEYFCLLKSMALYNRMLSCFLFCPFINHEWHPLLGLPYTSKEEELDIKRVNEDIQMDDMEPHQIFSKFNMV